jgi:hypothetical protein
MPASEEEKMGAALKQCGMSLKRLESFGYRFDLRIRSAGEMNEPFIFEGSPDPSKVSILEVPLVDTPVVVSQELVDNSPPARAREEALELAGQVRDIFNLWVNVTGRNAKTCKLTNERQAKIKARLRQYSYDDVRDAVAGVMKSEFHLQHKQTELTLILRDGTHLEKFRDLARAGVLDSRRMDSIGQRREPGDTTLTLGVPHNPVVDAAQDHEFQPIDFSKLNEEFAARKAPQQES